MGRGRERVNHLAVSGCASVQALDSVTSSPSNCAKAPGVTAIVSSPYLCSTLPWALQLSPSFPKRAPPGCLRTHRAPLRWKCSQMLSVFLHTVSAGSWIVKQRNRFCFHAGKVARQLEEKKKNKKRKNLAALLLCWLLFQLLGQTYRQDPS